MTWPIDMNNSMKNVSNILGQVVSTLNTHFVFIRFLLNMKN